MDHDHHHCHHHQQVGSLDKEQLSDSLNWTEGLHCVVLRRVISHTKPALSPSTSRETAVCWYTVPAWGQVDEHVIDILAPDLWLIRCNSLTLVMEVTGRWQVQHLTQLNGIIIHVTASGWVINTKFVGCHYTTSPGAPTVVRYKLNQKVHSWVVFGMYWCQ